MIIDWHQALQSTENALPTQTQEFYKQFVAERGKGYGNWGFTPVFRRAWSGRWSGRILFEGGCNPVNRHTDGCAPRVYVFSTEAHGSGVRVFVDNEMIIDRWDEGQSADRPGGLWVSTPQQISAGFHSVTMEWRFPCVGWELPCVQRFGPIPYRWPSEDHHRTSLWWSLLDSENTGLNTRDAMALETSVGWFATEPGLTTDDSQGMLSFEAGVGVIDFFADLRFSDNYDIKPALFGSVSSFGDPDAAHLRLVSADAVGATLFAEELVCSGVQAERREEQISWIAVQQTASVASIRAAPTLPTDTRALQSIHEKLALPEYLRWSQHNNSADPCIDLWLGVACNSVDGRVSRVVALDLGSMVRSSLSDQQPFSLC
jgi:hypothetical protein